MAARYFIQNTRQAVLHHPFREVLVQFAQESSTNLDTKLHIAETLLPYMYPKLSNITVEGDFAPSISTESQAVLLQKVLGSPELADAAQRLSIAAAGSMIDGEFTISGSDVIQ